MQMNILTKRMLFEIEKNNLFRNEITKVLNAYIIANVFSNMHGFQMALQLSRSEATCTSYFSYRRPCVTKTVQFIF